MLSTFMTLLAGLSGSAGPSPAVPPSAAVAGVAPTSTLPPEVALGVLRPGETVCPPGTGGWTLQPSEPPPLERFCEYRRPRSAFSVAAIPSKPSASNAPSAFAGLEGWSDAAEGAIVGQSDRGPSDGAGPTALSRAMATDLWASFARQIQLPAEPLVARGAPGVRLALVDTMPAGAPRPRSAHAPTLAALARALTCRPDRTCAVEVVHHLALPRIEGGHVDWVNGGHFGTLWDLARGIAEAVRSAAGHPRLIVNLSLGWDPIGTLGLPSAHLDLVRGSSSLPATVRAVHAAIVHARCRGALVLASTGNDDLGLGDRRGPLLPAAWAVHLAPTRAECVTLFGAASGAAVGAAPGSPLVHPVGGVDNDDVELRSARPASTPGLVAASAGAVPPGAGGVLTGTSVGAVVASAAAGLVWAIRPSLSADAVLDAVIGAGRTLGWSAGFCSASGPCGRVTSVSVCEAQRAACQVQPGGCGLPAACPAVAPHAWPFSMFFAGASAVLAQGPFVPVATASETLVGACGPVRLPSPNPWPSGGSCPVDQPTARRNLDTAPQPLDPMCPACFVVPQAQGPLVVLDVVGTVPGGALHEPHLFLQDAWGKVTRYALLAALPAGHQSVVHLGPVGPAGPIVSAWLQYELIGPNGPFSAAEPLLVDP